MIRWLRSRLTGTNRLEFWIGFGLGVVVSSAIVTRLIFHQRFQSFETGIVLMLHAIGKEWAEEAIERSAGQFPAT